MKNIVTIMSKEFTRFFTDRRMVLMTLFPAIMIYAIYTFMGSMMANVFTPDEDHDPWIYAVNAPNSITQIVNNVGISILHVEPQEANAVKERIAEREVDLLIIFPPDFDKNVDEFDVKTASIPAPNIEIYFMSTEPNSFAAYAFISTLLDEYESSLANKFDINRGVENADLATQEDIAANIISSLMPLLLMTFLYSGCMGLALESITGEKERGTLATLLVSPLKRRELAIGKILSLAALSFLSGAVTAFATIMALPNLMSGAEGLLDTAIYSAVDYALLALVILSTLLLMVAMISIVSAFAKTVKEAGQAAMPLMIIVMLVGVSGMFGGSAPDNPLVYMIPLYGSVQSMSGIFSLNYLPVDILLSCLSSIVFATIGGFVLTKMFNSEKIMFSR